MHSVCSGGVSSKGKRISNPIVLGCRVVWLKAECHEVSSRQRHGKISQSGGCQRSQQWPLQPR